MGCDDNSKAWSWGDYTPPPYVPPPKPKLWIGIDPGKSGALAAIDEQGGVSIFETPVESTGKKKDYDLNRIARILKILKSQYDIKAAIELVHAMPGQGVTSMFSMGYGFGIWRMALVAIEIPHEQVTPQAWKKLLMAGQPKDKKASVLVAAQLYPSAHSQLYGAKGGAKDGNGDALLIAEFLRRTNP